MVGSDILRLQFRWDSQSCIVWRPATPGSRGGPAGGGADAAEAVTGEPQARADRPRASARDCGWTALPRFRGNLAETRRLRQMGDCERRAKARASAHVASRGVLGA